MSKIQTKEERLLDVTVQRVRSAIAALPGSYSSRITGMLDRGDWLGIMHLDAPTAASYENVISFHNDYTCYNMLRKFDGFPVDIDRAAVAYEAFLSSEATCRHVNETIHCLPYESGFPLELQVTSILYRARDIIAGSLGKFRLQEFVSECDFSNGASTRLPRKKGHSVNKLRGPLHVTPAAWNAIVAFMWSSPAWREALKELSFFPQDWVTTVVGSKFDTVPKDSGKNRGICIEPEGNMFMQLGLGRMIRKRLKRLGIDLLDQRPNQLYAKLGVLLRLATIDLAQASDSIALELVKFLFPADWVEWILRLRSSYVTVGAEFSDLKGYSKLHKLEKVSSMGNGFTFELESMIFYAISRACVELHEQQGPSQSTVLVYGDDIIIPQHSVPTLKRVFDAIGFKVNSSKSFWDGDFRESCGKHYFRGCDVTPIYVKTHLCSLDRKFWWINTLRQYGCGELSEVADQFEQKMPRKDRNYVPTDFPVDSGIRCWQPPKGHWHRRKRLYRVKYYTKRSLRMRVFDSFGLCSTLLSGSLQVPLLKKGSEVWGWRTTALHSWS